MIINFLKRILVPVLLGATLACGITGCAILSKSPTTNTEVAPVEIIDLEDPVAVYKAGRLIGVGFSTYPDATVEKVCDLSLAILDSDPQHFQDVILEQAVVFLGDEFGPGNPQLILLGEFAAALGFQDFDNFLATGEYLGDIDMRMVRWFAHGLRDGVYVGLKQFVPYPTDWTIYDEPVEDDNNVR